jgi:cellulose synthase/poly-beta-1,6-N-acetylglucosamine synthase-like glycosyltransferase
MSSTEDTSSASSREGGLVLPDAPKCNVVGAYVIAGYLAVIFGYLATCWFGRWRASRGKPSELDSGKFRLAAATGRVDIMVGIQETRKDVFDIDCNVSGFTALHAACCQGQVGAVLWLLQNGADVEAVKNDGWKHTALHYAAARGNEEIVKMLIAYGAQADRENFLGETAAQVAANEGHRKISMYLTHLGSPFPSMANLSAVQSSRLSGRLSGNSPEEEEAERRRLHEEYQGCYFESRIDEDTQLLRWEKKVGRVIRASEEIFEEYMKRGNEGFGTVGTLPGRHLKGFRRIAGIYVVVSVVYLVWRALRSLHPGWWYFYSIPFYMIELVTWTLDLCFVYSLYYQVDRPGRSITLMLPEDELPKTDVFICRHSEPVEVLEATTVAALNMDYPGDKLSVYVLDDGKSEEVRAMCKRISYQLRYMDRRANLFYVGRTKKKGVPHHAKAGNINNCLLMHSSEDAEYILVLDCDMIVHPTFLHRTLGHFYVPSESGGWRQKEFVGLLQTPQDFWNVDSEDPMVHCARFFYGPMLQGRDGAGACPCCGTGVIFPRSTLISVGGQSYGSITEDCNTSMQLLSCGFANMFLNERLVYGMAPEDLPGVFKQRARWAMGALQILYRDNPLRKRGLTASQSFLFFEIGAHHYLAIGTAMATLVPLIYVYVDASPVIVEYLWEFCIVFGVFFACNRVMIWWAHRGCASGGTLEMWRGGQMWIWMCFSHIKAILKTFVGESRLFRCFRSFELTFKVTSKETQGVSIWEVIWYAWPFVAYLLAVAGSVLYFIVMAATGTYSTWTIFMTLTSVAWSIYISLCIWPPVSVLLPRVETEQGWRISWDTAIDESRMTVDDKGRVVRRSVRRRSSRRMRTANGEASREDSMISRVIHRMEEGADAYNWDALTMSAAHAYRPGLRTRGSSRTYSSESFEDADFASPFAHFTRDGDTDDPGASHAPRSQRGLSSLNIGRVALPVKTARGISSSVYTSMILPEPSMVPTSTKLSSQGGLDRSIRRDVRQLSLESLIGQQSLRSSFVVQTRSQQLQGTNPDWPTSGKHVVISKIGGDERGSEHSGDDFPSPFVGEGAPRADSVSGHLVVTEDGKFLLEGREIALDDLLSRVVDEMRFSVVESVGHSGSVASPLVDAQGRDMCSRQGTLRSFPLALSWTISSSRGLRRYGESLLRSMSIGGPAQGARGMSQPGSVALSMMLANLSQMQPSILQENGLVLPIVPEDVFAHTIAARPSFKQRQFPREKVTFFAVNGSILVGLTAGGIVSAAIFQGGI